MPTTRSPKHPSIGLPTALERTKVLFVAHQQNPATREVVAHGLGFNKLHGQSRRFISALSQYGLLEKVDGGELRISELAMLCLFPQSEQEHAEAVHQAASSPKLFRELQEKYPDSLPTEEIISSWLVRLKFSPTGAERAAIAYRETMEYVESLSVAPSSEDPAAESAVDPADDGVETSSARPPESPASYGGALAPGQFQVTADENARVSVHALQLDRDKVQKLRDMLDHLLGGDLVSDEPIMLSVDN